ncbi:hypothetical protein ABZY09_18765 [Streptomyces sp. NPDC002928]|uniref:hypothetical protein n=1 Tax=Streptomyces sp. NPDC002928 TaxID=3154440 RepID=UPI0033A09F8D
MGALTAVDVPEEAGATGLAPAPDVPKSPAGTFRRGTTGVRCTAGAGPGPANGRLPAGRSRPGAGRPEAWRAASPSRALDWPSRTEWDDVPMNDGFCQVGRRPPKPASATPARPGANDRWIGGSAGQAAATTGRAAAPAEPMSPPADTPDESAPLTAVV